MSSETTKSKSDMALGITNAGVKQLKGGGSQPAAKH
jgi:hypothetical protein